jgi:tetratricopeptide (TPR) repeat protein
LTERVNVLCARKQPNEALQAADEALQLAPASPYARYVRGRALGLLGRVDEAEAEMERILRDAPGTPMRRARNSSTRQRGSACSRKIGSEVTQCHTCLMVPWSWWDLFSTS